MQLAVDQWLHLALFVLPKRTHFNIPRISYDLLSLSFLNM